VASFYKDWASYGGGLTNYLSYGEFPTKGYGQPESFKYPRGVVLNRDLSTVHPVNATDSQEIKEYIASSWYSYERRRQRRHPSVGRRNQAELHRTQAAL
jgi:hydrogenase large subunit